MKYIFLILLIIVSFFSKAQGTFPLPSTGGGLPVKQFLGSDSTLMGNKGVFWSKFGTVNGTFTDTTAANLTRIKQYPGAQIFTTLNNTFWLRNSVATGWLSQGGGNFSITTINDSLVLICFGDGTCDTLFTQFFFQNDSTVISCSPVRITCIGDSCFQQQICDTISIPKVTNLVFQNGLINYPPQNHIVEHGKPSSGYGLGMLIHDTWLNTYGYQYTVQGGTLGRPPFAMQQQQWSQLSSSIASLNHYGAYHPGWGMPDSSNLVNLYFNYTDPFALPTQGALAGDTVGFMGNRYGYLLMTNSAGTQSGYIINDPNSKQVGLFFDTYSQNDDAINIFGNRVPSVYGFNLNPPTDSTLLDSRIATFKLNVTKDVQFHGYPSTRDDGPNSKALYTDADGNILLGTVASSTVNVYNDTLLVICSYNHGHVSCDTTVISVGGLDVQHVFVVNDSTLLVCNIDNTICDTVNIPQTFIDLSYFTPNQASFGATLHNANFKDFGVVNLNSFENTAGIQTSGRYTDLYFDSTLFNLQTHKGGIISAIVMRPDSILLAPSLGKLNIDTLQLGTSLDSVMVWNKTTGKVGYRNASSFGISGITADNGLTASTATNVQLGGTLIKNTSIATGAFNLTISTATAAVVPLVVTATTGIGVSAQVTSGVGVTGYASTGIGVQGSSDGATYGGKFQTYNAGTNNTVNPVLQLLVLNGSAPSADGFGEKIDFELMTSDFGTSRIANSVISKLTTAADANYTSQFIITGVDSTLTDNLLAMGDRVDLTESSATTFATTTIPDGKMGGGEIVVTVTANDAINFQARTLRFIWSAINKGGTLTFNNSTPDESISVSSGTLTAAITLVDAGSGILQFKANAVSSLTQNVLRCSYQIHKNF